mgnify:CR=1 FL=1
MYKFLLQRLVQGILVMLVVAFVAFAIFHFLGDPVNNMVGESATDADREMVRLQLGLDEPIVVQYFKFVGNILQGDFGISYRTRTSVIEQMAARLPATLELSLVSAFFSIVFGIPMGIYCALQPKSWLTRNFLVGSLVGISIPTFLSGLLLIYLFSVTLGWLPSQGRGGLVSFGWWDTSLLTVKGWSYIIMPALTLCIYQLTLITRMVRAEMLEVIRTDYIKFARARGLSKYIVQYRHALKNSLVPVVTIIGLQLGTVVAFSIITETVFNWPGLGQMFIQSIEFVDIPVMSAYLIFVGAFFVILNLIVDLIYALVDPRLRAA